MIVVEGYVNNDIDLAVCIFPSDLLKHDQLKDLMIDYTMFYANRMKQVCSTLDIVVADSIDDGIEKMQDRYKHILFLAAGVRIYDDSIIHDIVDEIKKTPNYVAAGHILDWKDKWYELHHQFILINVENWKNIGRPKFGDWNPGKDELVVIERSVENFHDDYTPLWVRDTGQREMQFHCKQGWNIIDKSLKAGYEIINWNQVIRGKRTYYYPETQSELFYYCYKNRKVHVALKNFNQKRLIKEMVGGVNQQIWVLNSEHMYIHNNKKRYEVIALPASGFKYLDVFQSNALVDNGEIIIYDYNQLSLDWINHIYTSNTYDIEELVRTFKDNHNLKWFGYNNPAILSDKGLAPGFLEGFKITQDFYKGKFNHYLKLFRNCPVQFIKTDLINNYFNLINEIGDRSCILHISNIFSTDFLVGLLGMKKSQQAYDKFISILHPNTKIVGHNAMGKFIA